MKHLIVTAAILIENGEILCMQRSESKYSYISYKYEFPGGKVEDGETFEQGLSRELKEEMNIDVNIKPEHFFMTIEHDYPDFSITMHSYLCPVSNRSFTRKEHNDHVWLKPYELDTLDWAPADIPIMKKLMEKLG
jgi:8-oxo-dGTP diphosphatase